jgi:hypothetical protein
VVFVFQVIYIFQIALTKTIQKVGIPGFAAKNFLKIPGRIGKLNFKNHLKVISDFFEGGFTVIKNAFCFSGKGEFNQRTFGIGSGKRPGL